MKHDTYVYRGAYTLEEEVTLKEDLTIGNRDNVRRDVCRYVTSLRFDDCLGCKASASSSSLSFAARSSRGEDERHRRWPHVQVDVEEVATFAGKQLLAWRGHRK